MPEVMLSRNLYRAAITCLFASVSGAAIAQTTAAPPVAEEEPVEAAPVAQTPVAQSGAIQDIIVTAQRRDERLQDVPIAVAAITGDALSQKGVQTTQDLQLSVPSLNYGNQSGFATPYLRGIGSDIASINSDPSIATYSDGVYLANNASTVVSLLGVERIEVLLGPQGTLYGKNALGGAINVVTRTPTDEVEGQLQLTGGNYGRQEANGYVSGPLADNLYGGIYGIAQRRDHYYDFGIDEDDRQLNGTPDHEWAWGLRGKLVWETGDLKLVGSVEHSEAAMADGNVFRNIQDPATGNVDYTPDDKYFDPSNARSGARPISTLAIVRADLDLDFATLVSISSYRKVNFKGGTDIDGTAVPIFSVFAESQTDDYSQEFQLQSPAGSLITWTAGVYGFYEKGVFDPTGFAGGPNTVLSYVDIDTTSLAAFGQATVPITDALNLTVGARYSYDHKKFSAFDATRPIVNQQLGAPQTLIAQYPDDKESWEAFTPKVTLDYQLGSTLLYATYSKGYKPGVYNAPAPSTPGPIDSEELTSYEVGSKSDFLGGKLRINTSVYLYKFKDIQIQTLDQRGGGATILQNGAKATAYGAELTSTAQITPAFSLNANVAYSHAEYDKFPAFASNQLGVPGGVNPNINVDAEGNKLARAPKWVVTGGAQYIFDLANADEVKLNADWYHNSGFYWDPSNQTKQEAYDVVNFSATYINDEGGWSAQAWMKNAFDEYYYNTVTITSLSVGANEARPRTYGLTLTKDF